jgi:hypothetical protein
VGQELVDTVFGTFQVEALIGRGGMGAVYRALDSATGERVALKVVEANGDERTVRRLRRETALLAELKNPHVVALRGGPAEQGSKLYFAMELLAGSGLEAVVAKYGTLPVPDVMAIALAVLQGLEAAHAEGVVHRDMKPSNVFLTSQGAVKILDFGLARASDASQLTLPGEILGTPRYMSPEQCQGRPLDGRTDIYSSACIFYELLAGAPPFSAPNALVNLQQHVAAPVPPIARPLPQGLEGTLRRALEKDPAQRFGSAGEFAAALRAIGVTAAEPAALAALVARPEGAASVDEPIAAPTATTMIHPLSNGTTVTPAREPEEEIYWTGSVALVKTIATAVAIWAVAASLKPRVVTDAESTWGPVWTEAGKQVSRARFEPALTIGALVAIFGAFAFHGVLRAHWRRAGLFLDAPDRPVENSRWILVFGVASGALCAARWGIPGLSVAVQTMLLAGSLLTNVALWFFVFLTALSCERARRPFWREWKLWAGLFLGFGPLVMEFVRWTLLWVPPAQ